jgi:hypothetical protein
VPTTSSVLGSISATSFVDRSVTQTFFELVSNAGVPVSLLKWSTFTGWSV